MKPVRKTERAKNSRLIVATGGAILLVAALIAAWVYWPRPTVEETEIDLVKPVQAAFAEFRAAAGREPKDVPEFEPQLRQAYGREFKSLEKRAADQYVVHIDRAGPRRIVITYRVDRDGQPEAFETLVEAGP